jgi:hypothetical protein
VSKHAWSAPQHGPPKHSPHDGCAVTISHAVGPVVAVVESVVESVVTPVVESVVTPAVVSVVIPVDPPPPVVHCNPSQTKPMSQPPLGRHGQPWVPAMQSGGKQASPSRHSRPLSQVPLP